MELLRCNACGQPLEEDARFCGECGRSSPVMTPPPQRPAPWPETGTAGPAGSPAQSGGGLAQPVDDRTARVQQVDEPPAPPRPTPTSGVFFQHATADSDGQASNATRYLSAAAYLERSFANRVIGELLGSHRAVVRSLDFDLGPIIRHCLTARRFALGRDIFLTLLMLISLIIAPASTILVLVFVFALAMIPGARWGHRRVGGKLAAAAAVMVAIAVAVFIVIIELAKSFFTQATEFGASPSPSGGLNIAAMLALLVLVSVVQVIYTYSRFRMLSERLRPDARPVRFPPSNGRVEARIAQIEAAQRGNVTLYGGENPFIGAGSRAGRVWSIAIELDRARPGRSGLPGGPGGYVAIDPVELHQDIRRRMLKLKDADLPAHERVAALEIDDHVIGEGRRKWDSPLIDQAAKIPYSDATQEAIQALIRHPQAGLRYYQRISINDTGTPVFSGGREVIDGVDQGIVVSSFVHLAVEGRMFYLEFVTMVLPPIQRRFQVIDQLPVMSSGQFFSKVMIEAISSLFGDMIHSPAGIYRTCRLMLREQHSFSEEAASHGDSLMADLGAQCSVREVGGAARTNTHLQVLDAAKYTKIIERRLTDTVLDFLTAKGVDISEFASGISTIINNSTIVTGNTFGGPVAFGQTATATQTFGAAQARAPATPG